MSSRPSVAWAQLLLFYSAGFGARWMNTIYYKPDGAIPGGFDVQVAAADMYNAAAAKIKLVMTDTVTMGGARFFVNNGVYTTSADHIGTVAGTAGSASIPPDDFVVVRCQTNAAGRAAKGRILLSGLDQAMQDNGRISTAGIASFTTITTFLQTAVMAGGHSFTAAHFNKLANTFLLPDFWSFNPVLGNKKKRSPIL